MACSGSSKLLRSADWSKLVVHAQTENAAPLNIVKLLAYGLRDLRAAVSLKTLSSGTLYNNGRLWNLAFMTQAECDDMDQKKRQVAHGSGRYLMKAWLS